MTQAAVMFPQQQAHLALMYVKSAMHSQWKNQSVTVTQNAQRKNPIRIALYAAVKTGIFRYFRLRGKRKDRRTPVRM